MSNARREPLTPPTAADVVHCHDDHVAGDVGGEHAAERKKPDDINRAGRDAQNRREQPADGEHCGRAGLMNDDVGVSVGAWNVHPPASSSISLAVALSPGIVAESTNADAANAARPVMPTTCAQPESARTIRPAPTKRLARANAPSSRVRSIASAPGPSRTWASTTCASRWPRRNKLKSNASEGMRMVAPTTVAITTAMSVARPAAACSIVRD